ncbi:MAG: hypothetical protein R6V30_02480 [Paracoccaceae bacterium]
MKPMVAATLLCLLVACTDRRDAPVAGETYVIRNDGGGQLISAEADRARLAAWGGPVRIEGKCNSACLMFATLPNACVAADARMGFHGSNVNVGPVGNQQMARYMRGEVRQRYLADWQHIPHDRIHIISGAEFARLDPQTRLCGR